MATYIPNATQTTEPVESRTVESAALEFRTLKTSINARIEDVQDGLDTEIVNRIAGDANLQTQNNAQDVRLQAIEAALLVIGEGGLPGTVYVQRLSGTGAQTSFTLNVSVPSSALIDVFINGIYQNKNTFTIVDDVLTFSEAPPAGTDNVEVVVSITIANVETDASLVSFRATDSTVVVRTVQDKMREWVSVKDFGAVGDGSDATTAFAAALAAHDNIYVPAGTYAVTGITMSSKKVLFGDGEESVINCSGTIDFTDARKGGMRNLRVNLTSASTTLVRLQKGGGVGSFELYFEDVNFVGNIANASTVGIHITDSYINTFVNCLFIDFDKAIIHGVEANRNNYFGCSIRARTTYGTVLVEQTAGQANSFMGCDLENCNRMLDLSGGSIFFDSGCYFEAHNDSFGFKLTGGHVGIDHCYFNEVFIDLQANGSLEFAKNWVKASSLSNATYPVIRVRPNFSRLILDNNILEGATYLCRMNPTRYDYLQQYDSGTGNYVNAYPSNSQHLSIDDMIYDVDTAAIRQCHVDNVRAVRSRAEYYSEGRVRFDGTAGLQLVASNWNYNPLRIGANYLWVDATGKLRIKNGAPAFDVDGTVVGTQT